MADHVIYRGDHAPFEIIVNDQNGIPVVDITGWTFKLSLTLRRGTDPAFSIDGTISNPLEARVGFELTPTETANVAKYYYDVQATTQGGKVFTIDTGKIKVIQDITP